MNKTQLLSFIDQLDNSHIHKESKLFGLVQLNNSTQVKDLLNEVQYSNLPSKFKIDFRNAKIYTETQGQDCCVKLQKIVNKNDYYSICGLSFNFIALGERSTMEVKSYVLSRLRLLPQKVFFYNHQEMKEITTDFEFIQNNNS